jgi:hypothetical protein
MVCQYAVYFSLHHSCSYIFLHLLYIRMISTDLRYLYFVCPLFKNKHTILETASVPILQSKGRQTSIHSDPTDHRHNFSELTNRPKLQDLRFSQRCCWGFMSSVMWQCVIGRVVPDVLKAIRFFKTSGTTHPTTQHHIQLRPEPSRTKLFSMHHSSLVSKCTVVNQKILIQKLVINEEPVLETSLQKSSQKDNSNLLSTLCGDDTK